MNAVLVSKENNVAKFTMAFTAEEFDAALDKAYREQRGKIEVPGFRKGKAPRSVIEKRYGEGIFFEDAIDNCLATGYPQALEELALEPVDRPDLAFGEEKLEKGKGFEVTVTVTVAPEVVVKDYKGVKVEVTKKELNEEDVEGELKAMQQKTATPSFWIMKAGAKTSSSTAAPRRIRLSFWAADSSSPVSKNSW